jgi:hypothetical protein
LVGPVDGVFHRGAFYFGSSPTSVRFRHIAERPQVSATHLPSEELAVTVHGRAVPVDVRGPEAAGFRRALLDVYVPRYGPEWEQFLDSRSPSSAAATPTHCSMPSEYDLSRPSRGGRGRPALE